MSGHFTEKTRAVILARDEGACFVCGVHCYDVEGGFPRMAYSLQHRRARGMGGSSHPVTGSPVNGITVCGTATTGCHQRIEANPNWAEQQGYRVRQGVDPASVSVHHVNRGPIFLLPDGGFTYEAPEVSA